MKHGHAIVMAALALALLCSCGTAEKVLYFQDLKLGENELALTKTQIIKVRPEDKLSIVVNSRDPQLTDLFNLPYISRYLGSSSNNATANYRSNQAGVSGYTVDSHGCIDFPVLGRVHIGGMTREEVAAHIKDQLVSNNLVKDPVVTVEFLNLHFSVIGEVAKPGLYNFDRDRLTVLDAIGIAGDLTIYGNRNKVTVLRQEGDTQKAYVIDMTSGANVYSSPGYFLQQNDVVYVEPNAVRARQSTVNGNNLLSTSFWISIASLLTSAANLIW